MYYLTRKQSVFAAFLTRSLIFLCLLFENSGYSFSSSVGYKLFQATDASHNNSFMINPAVAPSVAVGGANGAKSRVRVFLLKQNNNAKFSQSDGTQENETSSELSSYGLSALLDAGAGLYVALNHERHFAEYNSTTTNSTQNTQEKVGDFRSELKASVEITANVAIGILIRFLDTRATVYGNYFISEDESTAYEGSMFGPGGGIKGSFPLGGGSVKQIDFSFAYLQPLKGKTEVYGEQLIITEPGIQEIGFSVVLNKINLGVTSRNYVYKLDDRYFGSTYPNDDQTDIELMGLGVDKQMIFELGHLQFGFDYMLSNTNVLRASLAKEKAQINFDPERDLPEVDAEGKEQFEYQVLSVSFAAEKNGLNFEGTLNRRSREHTWTQFNDQRGYEGSLTEYVISFGKFL